MIRGIYTATSGMMAQHIKQETIANNLANLNTSGYKKETTVFHTFPDVLLVALTRRTRMPPPPPVVGLTNIGVLVEENHTLHTQGDLMGTDNPLDFALEDRDEGDNEGAVFFTVETPEGIRYTRSGHFLRDLEGNLVTPEGYFVLGVGGRININTEDIVVEKNGDIIEVVEGLDENGDIIYENQLVDTFLLSGFLDPEALRKEGDNLFVDTPQAGPFDPGDLDFFLHQGFLERANIDLVKEMTDALVAFRAYEANHRMVLTQDELLGKAVNEVGVLR